MSGGDQYEAGVQPNYSRSVEAALVVDAMTVTGGRVLEIVPEDPRQEISPLNPEVFQPREHPLLPAPGLALTDGPAHLGVMLVDEQASPEQIEVLRRMTPEQRWQAAHRLYWTARRHKAAFLRSQHPDWPDQQVEGEVRRTFSSART